MYNEQNILNLYNRMKFKDDEKAFELLFHAFYNPLVRFAEHYVKSEFVVEEIVSDVLYTIWNKRSDLDIGNLRSYLFRATKNRCLNELQRSNFNTVFIENPFSESAFPEIAGTPLVDLEEAELFALFDEAVEKLPRQCKLIFNLVRNEQMSHNEVAEILNISAHTVNAQLFIAVKKITAYVEGRADVKLKSSRSISGALHCFFNFL